MPSLGTTIIIIISIIFVSYLIMFYMAGVKIYKLES